MNERTDTFATRLKCAMQIRKMSAVELSRRTGYNKANISQWVNGVHEAMQDGVYKLATALNVSEAWLMGYDVPMERESRASQEDIEKWEKWDSKLNQNGKLAKEVAAFESVLKKIPLYDTPVSAGTGAWLAEGHEYEFHYFEDAPQNADFALRVRGDSMQPMYDDDDIIFVKTNVIIESGQIGVFCLNGEGYMKMLQGNKLVSLNKNYKPVVVKEWDSFHCVGRVVGKTTIGD